jgi:transglutaminase-like putative cysteine protease
MRMPLMEHGLCGQDRCMGNSTVEDFVTKHCSGSDAVRDRIAVFQAIRDLPYATDQAHTAQDLLEVGSGDCLAKTALLSAAFTYLGYASRTVRWLYELPDQPREVRDLPSRLDLHSAVAVYIQRWLLVDATHDPPLGRSGFVVASWDGHTSTLPAYPLRGPIWRVGIDNDEIESATADLTKLWRGNPVTGYREAFTRWLRRSRRLSAPPV